MICLKPVYFLVIALLTQASLCSALQDNKTFCNNLSIMGGYEVSIEEAPFMVAVYEPNNTQTDRYEAIGCGGSLIHERFVLSAAHCFSGRNVTSRKVLIGSDRLTASEIFIDVEEQMCHENFSFRTLTYDICLLKLATPVPLGSKVAIIELADKDFELEEGTLVNVTGWGILEENDTALPNDLHQVSVPIVSQKCCSQYYNYLDVGTFCAGSLGHDPCKGDSGGPLTYNGKQLGIVSYGRHCGVNPGVYTRVASYLEWINNIINHQ